jgi:zinc transport system ATP-binding protein
MPEARPVLSCGDCCTRLVQFGVTLGSERVLADINLHIHCGELTAIIGPNGAGKTTLLRALLDEVAHTGEMRFVHGDGHTRFDSPRIGYVPQRFEIDPSAPISVLDLFAGAVSRWPLWLGRRRAVRAAAAEVLSLVRAEDMLDRPLGQLSPGQLQRVMLALALAPVPDLLLLDEPISGVDQAGVDLFYEMISQLRNTYHLSILLVTHDLPAAARVADRMIFLNRSILCDGSPAEVLASRTVSQYFGGDYATLPALQDIIRAHPRSESSHQHAPAPEAP